MSLKFQRVFSDIQSKIFNGTWKYGEKIPTEMELCEKYDVSRITIRRALDKLVKQGIIIRTRGRGSYVGNRRLVAGTSHEWFKSKMEELGNPSFTRKVIHMEKMLATGNLAKALRLDISDKPQYIWYFKSVGYLDDVPVGIGNSYVLESIGDIMAQHADELDVYYYLDFERATGMKYVSAQGSLSAVCANDEICELLQVSPGTSCLWSRTVGCVEDGTAVEVRYTIYNGNMFEFAFNVDIAHPAESYWASYN